MRRVLVRHGDLERLWQFPGVLLVLDERELCGRELLDRCEGAEGPLVVDVDRARGTAATDVDHAEAVCPPDLPRDARCVVATQQGVGGVLRCELFVQRAPR